MTIWRMIVHHENRAAAIRWTRESRRIAIGWGDIGDVAAFGDKAEIKSAIKSTYLPPHPNNGGSGSESLWSFCHDVRPGDLVILGGAKGRELVVEVTGDYEFVEGESPLIGEYLNQRQVEITEIDANKLWDVAGGLEEGVSRYRTLVKCQNAVDVDAL